eukprot:579491-Pyramimonas_sp.AAC.1
MGSDFMMESALRNPIFVVGAGIWVAPHSCYLRPIFLGIGASGYSSEQRAGSAIRGVRGRGP